MDESIDIVIEQRDAAGVMVRRLRRRVEAGGESMLVELLSDAAVAGVQGELERVRRIADEHTRPPLRLAD